MLRTVVVLVEAVMRIKSVSLTVEEPYLVLEQHASGTVVQ